MWCNSTNTVLFLPLTLFNYTLICEEGALKVRDWRRRPETNSMVALCFGLGPGPHCGNVSNVNLCSFVWQVEL